MKKVRFLCVLFAALLVLCALPLAASADAGDLLNLQLYLIDSNSNALSNYIVVINNNTQSIANSSGIASIPAADAGIAYDLKLFTPDKKQVGECVLNFKSLDGGTAPVIEEGESVNGVDTHTIGYVTPNASLYLYIMGDPKGTSITSAHPAGISESPLQPGKVKSAPSSTATPKSTASSTPSTNPVVYGYLIDVNGAPLSHATVKSQNDKTGSSLSAVTESDGAFKLPGIAEGEHSIYVTDSQGADLGEIDLIVKAGSKTEIQDIDDDPELDIYTGLGSMYMNLQTDGHGNLVVLDVSEKPLASPATAEATPTPVPSEVPITTPEPVVEPTAEPTPEATATPMPEPAPTPVPSEGGLSDQMMLILIVVIIAAAVVIIVALVLKSRQNNSRYR